MEANSPVSTDVTSIFHDLAETAERVRAQADAELLLPESSTTPGSTAPGAQLGMAAAQLRAEVLTTGARGLEKLAEDPHADLSPDEAFGVEAIVLREGRPALLVRAGDFPSDLPPDWTALEQQRAAIRDSIARVGRIEVDGHPDLDWVGTGFLVGPDLVMTNRHVANEFARRDGDDWTFQSGRSSRWDLLEEDGDTTQLEFAVTEIVGVHTADDVDLALLRVEGSADGGLPEPLLVAAASPSEVVGRTVYVVGYPAWDGRRNEPDDMKRIFMDIYNVKRMQPGRITVSADSNVILRHDCSTLGGNSGSPVFDLETHQVIGLHFGGRYLVGNQAVPMWRMADDPFVGRAGVNFS